MGKETLEQQEETVVAAQHSGAPLLLIIGIPVWVGWVAEDSQKILSPPWCPHPPGLREQHVPHLTLQVRQLQRSHSQDISSGGHPP